MGAEPWSYFVPYREDIAAALEDLKRQEFEAGRYRMPDPDHPPATIGEACLQFPASGTASILDIQSVSDTPLEVGSEVPVFCAVSPLSPAQLVALYGTDRPTHAMIKANRDFYDWIERGCGIYIVVYGDGGAPSELFFAGYSFD